MSISIDPPQQTGTQGNTITLKVKGTALKDVPLEIWFDDLTQLKKSTRSSPTTGAYSVDLVIPLPSAGDHQVFVKDMNPQGKTVPIDVRFPLPVVGGLGGGVNT